MDGYALENRYHTGVLNLIENLDSVWEKPSLYNLAKIFKGVPAMVIGAGPSLESVLPLVREYQDRFVLFSSNSALKTLLSYGITPQFVVGLELRDETKCFSNISTLGEVYGIFSSCCHPSFYKFSFKKIFIYNLMDFPFGETILYRHRFPQIPGGGTVTVPAMFSAYIAGAKEILFLGQDLAFKNRRKYAVASGGTMIESDRDFIKVPGINGVMVETSRGFQACIQQVSMMAKQLKKRNVICYNMNSEGAQIDGLKNEQFAKWVKTHKHPKIKDIESIVGSNITDSVSVNLINRIRDMTGSMENLIRDLFVSPVADLEKVKNENPMALCFEDQEWKALMGGTQLEHYKAFGNKVLDKLKALASRNDRQMPDVL